MSSETPKFYLTTPIYYVNDRPHIGHAYTTIVADVLARRHRLLGEDTFFLTGTDEHGQKIERSAAAAGMPPQEFTDGVSAEFKQLWDRMGLTFNKFIRTTDLAHKHGVQKLFRELYDRGFIYLSTYTGSYCVSDEAFVDQPARTPCPDCGRLLETVTEENFFFKLREFQLPLLDLIESNELRITPDTARNEVLSFLRGNISQKLLDHPELLANDDASPLNFSPSVLELMKRGELAKAANGQLYIPGVLKDLSVSRSSFTWGIPVPEDVQLASGTQQHHVIYVWLDALANYITAIGYGSDDPADEKQFNKYWPADLHLVGKEITRFHCVYWPAFLLAAGLPTPKQITANGWLLFDNAKMSKSRGNVVRTETILDAFGDHVYGKQFPDSTKQERDLFAADVLRYFLLREIPFGQDGSFSFDALFTRYNADLANGYGNLVSRTLSMLQQFCAAKVPAPPSGHSGLVALQGGADKVIEDSSRVTVGLTLNTYLEACSYFISQIDGYLTARAPWRDPNVQSRSDTLYTAAESIRIITALLHPILPYATARVWAQLGLGDIEAAARSGELNHLEWGGLKPGTKLGPLGPIFPRAPKELAQHMIDMEEARSTSAHPASNRPEAPLKAAATPTPAAPIAANSSDPAAPPRTSSLDEPSGTLTVGGSSAETTTLPTTPGPHTEALASGPFANAPAHPSPEHPEDTAPLITIDDFLKVELRVAQVLVAERIPKADKLLRLEVDLGTERRQILSGIAQWYTPEELIGRRIVVVANLAPRKMRGLESHGMLLAASEGADGKPVLATFGEDIALGSRVR